MTALGGLAAVLAEAWRITRSQVVVTALVAALAAASCVGILLTSGQTAAAQEAVLEQIDAAGTRSLVVRVPDEAYVPTGVLDTIATSDGVQEVTGFSRAEVAANADVDAASAGSYRVGYGTIGGRPLHAITVAGYDDGALALASERATQALGLVDDTGPLLTPGRTIVTVVGDLDVPEHLAAFEPLTVIPASTPERASGTDVRAPLDVMVVLARTPDDLDAVEALVRGVTQQSDGPPVRVETSAELAEIRAAVDGEIGAYSRTTVLGVAGLTIVLTAVSLLALMNGRRRDFGRRRALGAGRSLIAALVLLQVTGPAVLGALLGILGIQAWLLATDQPRPGLTFTFAVGVVAVLCALLAALAPAVIASRRDPVHELRVP